jgi:FkbM family methyltransferase
MIVGFDEYKHKYQFNVTGVIHVGAHFGQEYDEYINEFGFIPTYWFEPIPNVYKELSCNLNNKPNTFYYNVALGEKNSVQKMYLDEGNEQQSSSLLKPKELHNFYPHIKFSEKNIINITLSTLDFYDITSCNVLVLDTQGYELNALKGSINTLKNIDYIFTEFNLIEMYDGCPSIEQLDEFLSPFGFKRQETWNVDGVWGDAFYLKRV